MIKAPDLEFLTPDCTVCDESTCTDGTGWWCEGCGSTWAYDGTEGEAGSA